jgi:hypothetical protein
MVICLSNTLRNHVKDCPNFICSANYTPLSCTNRRDARRIRANCACNWSCQQCSAMVNDCYQEISRMTGCGRSRPVDSRKPRRARNAVNRRQLRTLGHDGPYRGPHPGQAPLLTTIHIRPAEAPSNAASRCPASEIPTPRVRHWHPLTQTPAVLH